MKLYTKNMLVKAKEKYKKGMIVFSPMTVKKFSIDRISGSWHKEYIYGFDGQGFYDVVWYKGKWAQIMRV